MARNILHPVHFCRTPKEAVCGASLSANDFELFYNNTTNSFAHITCKECQDVMGAEFDASGFSRPAEWTVGQNGVE